MLFSFLDNPTCISLFPLSLIIETSFLSVSFHCLVFAFLTKKLSFYSYFIPFHLVLSGLDGLLFCVSLLNSEILHIHLFNELMTILLTLIWSITMCIWLPRVPRLTQIVSLLAVTNAIENKNLVSFQSASFPFSFLIIYFIFKAQTSVIIRRVVHYSRNC